jgi:hypothetical protein
LFAEAEKDFEFFIKFQGKRHPECKQEIEFLIKFDERGSREGL